jgi:hypothetical protein
VVWWGSGLGSVNFMIQREVSCIMRCDKLYALALLALLAYVVLRSVRGLCEYLVHSIYVYMYIYIYIYIHIYIYILYIYISIYI